MDQIPDSGNLFHPRVIILISLLTAVVYNGIQHAFDVAVEQNSWILFGFEYAILLFGLTGVVGRYALNCWEIWMQPEWEEKSVCIFYLELVTDFLKLVAYAVFFVLVVNFYGLPIHILRDLYLTLQSFVRRAQSMWRYRQATRDLEALCPTVNREQLNEMADKVCVVCREEMVDAAKKLNCGHVFHFKCLRSWLERQQSCPTCRRPIVFNRPPATQPRPPQARPNAAQVRPEQNGPEQVRPEGSRTATEMNREQLGSANVNLGENIVVNAPPGHVMAGTPRLIPLQTEVTTEELSRLNREAAATLQQRLRLLHRVEQQIREIRQEIEEIMS